MLVLANINSFGITDGERIVQCFGNNMAQWCNTKNKNFREAALKLCHDSNRCMVIDDMMKAENQKGEKLSNKHFQIPLYMNIFQTAFMSGDVSFTMSDIKEVPFENICIENLKKSNEEIAKKFVYVSCNIQIDGILNYKLRDVFAINEDKIYHISAYKETADNKIVIDEIFKDALEEWRKKQELENVKRLKENDRLINDYFKRDGFGLTFNYSKHFPIGGSLFYAWDTAPVLLSLDMGYSNKKTEYIIDKEEMADNINYKSSKKTVNPKWYMTITPHVYFKYFAVGCGFGTLIMEGEEEISEYHYTSSSNEMNSSSGVTVTTTEDCNVYKFMIRPTIKGFIPLDRDDTWSIVVSAGYDWVFGYKEKNGLNVGLGIKANLYRNR